MKTITLGKTGIVTPQNAFGALPIQRVPMDDAIRILRKAYEGGMIFFDTARMYTDSEEKIGRAFEGMRDKIFIATKSKSNTPEELRAHLDESLKILKTDYIDIYQFHIANQCYKPDDGTGMYESMLEAKKQGKIRHIGITTHKIHVAEEVVASGLYDTVQYPFSYLASDRELAMVASSEKADMGYIAMKGLSGGLLTNSAACMAFMSQFDNVLPIWGIQREKELEEWLSYFTNTPTMTPELQAVIDADRMELMGDFCRSCGYCAPCTVGIVIHECARISQMIRRAPTTEWFSEKWQKEVEKIKDCIECGLCMTRCPYQLNIPKLLKKNYEDYHINLAEYKKTH